MWFIVICTLIDNEYASLLFCQTLFSYCFCPLCDFAKVFEWKVRRVQVAHLHNAARALSSPSRLFQLSTNLDKFFFRYLWYCDRATSQIWKILPNMVFPPIWREKMAAFWACACKLSWTLFSPARVQPLYGAGRKESSGTGLGKRPWELKWSETI